jgi:hypothetical protein
VSYRDGLFEIGGPNVSSVISSEARNLLLWDINAV